ncbi:MAG: four helix bundle protein [Bacillota bacterium]
MAQITRFEDIEAWKKARELTKAIYEITSVGKFAGDFGLRNQIRSAAISIMSNIAEGFERNRNSEFRYFLSVAKESVGEVKAQIYVAMDAGLINEAQFEQLYKSATETGQLIGGFIKYLNQLKIKSPKSKPMPNP